MKNVEVVDTDAVESDGKKVNFGSTVRILDKELKEEMVLTIKGASEADSLNGSISNESPLGKALLGAKKGETVSIEAPVGTLKYKILEIMK